MTVTGWARRGLDQAFRGFAHWRSEQLERQSVAEAQANTLRRLVHHARHTRFGREHDFDGIRCIQDYQDRVPLRDYEQFWREYWQPSFPHLTNVTWPGTVPYLALSSGTTSGVTKYIPVSRQMLRSNRKAGLTALCWFRAAHPRVPLFTGSLFFLGGSTDLIPMGSRTKAGDLSGIVSAEVPSLLRPLTFPQLDLALLADWELKLRRMAERSVHLPITMVSGVPSWMLTLFDELLRVTGRQTVAEVWPQLQLVLHGGTKFDPYRALMRQVIGGDAVHFLETYPASEGFVAAEDPRHGLLRLIPDHDLFFEFVPVEQLGASDPIRQTVAEIEVGVQYAVILTTCAGLWSYVLGDTVCFESCDPPLLRFTGRTRQFLSAFGEHLIGEEVETAVSRAAAQTDAHVVDFHVGPVFADSPGVAGRHCFFVEFARQPTDVAAFGAALDGALHELNADYASHRFRDLTLAAPEIVVVPRGGFAAWMRSRGQLGGQHKVPRLDNSGSLTQELSKWCCLQEVDKALECGALTR